MNKRDFLKLAGCGVVGAMFSPNASAWSLRGTGPSEARNWMWLRKKPQSTGAELVRLLRTAHESGITDVLPEVYNSKHALYRTDRHPQGELWLEELIPIAHDEGLRVHAWMWQMPCNQKAVIADHPDWFAVNGRGEPTWEKPAYVPYYRFMCPSRPGVHEFLRGNVAEVAAIDGVDGVHLDYIRYPDVILARQFQKKYGIVQDKEYPEYDYCYCEVCREDFRMAYGTDPLKLPDPSSSQEWRQFRYDRITHLVNDILLPEIRKRGKLTTAAVFPNWESVRQKWIDWKIDAVLPMLYHGFYDEDVDWIGERVAWGEKELKGKMELYAGLFVGHLDPESLPMAIASAKAAGADGISLFEGLSMDEGMWKALRSEVAKK